jgi:dihydropteroate synthase
MEKQTMIMGVLNVTPDSFYDGGLYFDHEKAIERGLVLVDQGADIVDIGGESTRPGASPVPAEEELRRVIPVIRELAPKVRISIDTFKAEVAKEAVKAGATFINDVGGNLSEVAAESNTALVVMHRQGEYRRMQDKPYYQDVVAEVYPRIIQMGQEAAAKGVNEIYIDPGIGFGKSAEHNLSLLGYLPILLQNNAGHFPLLVGASRKRFLGHILAQEKRPEKIKEEDLRAYLQNLQEKTFLELPKLDLTDDSGYPPMERKEASLASAAFMLLAGVKILRVHDVPETKYILDLMGELQW